MPYPHCAEAEMVEQPHRTAHGYRPFRCGGCRRVCNERTGTHDNYLQYPIDLVLRVALWWLRYTLRLRALAELFLERGFVFTHEPVRGGAARVGPLLADRVRAKRRGG